MHRFILELFPLCQLLLRMCNLLHLCGKRGECVGDALQHPRGLFLAVLVVLDLLLLVTKPFLLVSQFLQ